jgi:hypothetical protein
LYLLRRTPYATSLLINFDMEILSFDINCAPRGKKTRGYAVRLSINLQPPTSLSAIVNAFP